MSSTDLARLDHQQFSFGKNENGAGERQRRFAKQNIKLNGLVCKSGAIPPHCGGIAPATANKCTPDGALNSFFYFQYRSQSFFKFLVHQIVR